MRSKVIYPRVLMEMILADLSLLSLADACGIHYVSLRRKLRGDSPLHLDEALSIRKALHCSLLLEDLFERRS